MKDLGEKGFISSLLPLLHESVGFMNGFGHDVSVIDLGFSDYVAFKIDRAPKPVLLALGVLDYSVWGRLAAVANISDLIAGGAEPHAVMISLVLPPGFSADDARNIVLGCRDACEEHGVRFVGGDTKEGDAPQVVGAAIGRVSKDHYWSRKKAAPGDRLYVTGRLGGAAAAMSALTDGSLPRSEQLIDILKFPRADVQLASELREAQQVFAACDLSDGLADAIAIFCDDSVGIVVDADLFPLHPVAVEYGVVNQRDPWPLAFTVGDWGLALVVKEANLVSFEEEFCRSRRVVHVGTFTAEADRLLRLGDRLDVLPAIRNEHFRQRLEDGIKYLDLFNR